MQRRRQGGCITRHRGWWVVRYRQQVFVDGKVKTVIRNRRLAPVDAKHKTKASVRSLAAEILAPLNRTSVSPLRVMTVGDFVEGVYLPFAEQQKRPSTYRGYKQIWYDYLKDLSASAWMREVKTYDVQGWLDGIARQPHREERTGVHALKDDPEAREAFPEWSLPARSAAGLLRWIEPGEAGGDSGICARGTRRKSVHAGRNRANAEGSPGTGRDCGGDSGVHRTSVGRVERGAVGVLRTTTGQGVPWATARDELSMAEPCGKPEDGKIEGSRPGDPAIGRSTPGTLDRVRTSSIRTDICQFSAEAA